jgi:hypothetical protein
MSGLIGQISLINLSASWNHGPIGIIGVVGFGHIIALSASAVSSACWLIGLDGLIGLLTHRQFLDSLATALIAEDVVVACSPKEKVVLVACLFLANPTTVTCYNMQNIYFLSGFRK